MKHINIGLFGFGCVGQGLYETINNSNNFSGTITKICIKNASKKRHIDSLYFTTDPNAILENKSIDVVVELIDDADAALQLVEQALRNGKSVVTANKKMVAENLAYLVELQRETGKAVLYEGAVCGSIPIIRTLEEYFGHEPLKEIKGIFNGSTNYILTKVFEEQLTYESALEQAQNLGFAETDPTLDVQGFDAKYKLSILLTHAFGIHVAPKNIVNLGIDRLKPSDLEYTREKGLGIKLIAKAVKANGQVYGFVIPQFVEVNDSLASIKNEFNAVTITGEFCDEQLFTGKGAGSLPTGAAVLSDISALSYNYKYEYKKHNNLSQLPFSNEPSLQVYVSFNRPQDINLQDFESLSQKFFCFEQSYAIGKIKLSQLLNAGLRENPNVNIIVQPVITNIENQKLSIQELELEVGDLRKGQKILEKISV